MTTRKISSFILSCLPTIRATTSHLFFFQAPRKMFSSIFSKEMNVMIHIHPCTAHVTASPGKDASNRHPRGFRLLRVRAQTSFSCLLFGLAALIPLERLHHHYKRGHIILKVFKLCSKTQETHSEEHKANSETSVTCNCTDSTGLSLQSHQQGGGRLSPLPVCNQETEAGMGTAVRTDLTACLQSPTGDD